MSYNKQLLKRSIFALGSVLMACTILSVGSAGAVEYGGIGLKPANPKANNPRSQSIFIYSLKGGQTQTDAVKLINNTSTVHNVQLYAVDSVTSSDGAFACAQAVDVRKDVGKWIALSKNELALKPFSSVVVPFTVSMPAPIDAGEHDGCLVMQDTAKSDANTAAGISLSFRSAVRVAITVPGKLVAKLQLDSVTQKSENQKSLVVTPAYTNTGNVSLDTTIKISFKNVLGHTSAQGGGQFPVLPSNSSRFNLEIKKPYWGGLYHREVSTTYKMLSSSSVARPEAKSLPTASSWVLIAPQPAAAVIEGLIAAVIAAAIIYLVMRRRSHRVILLNTEDYKVKKGDNLQAVAEKYNISWKTLAKINHMRPPYALTAGQQIKVPNQAKKTSNDTDQ